MVMKLRHIAFAGAIAMGLGACTTTGERLGGAGVGAVAGGAIAGPVGAVVGGVAGAVSGPTVARDVGVPHRRHYRHYRRHRY